MSIVILLLLGLAALLVIGAVGWGTLLLLVQLGVIVKEAGKPSHVDYSNYTLDQGREIGREDQRR